MVRTRRHRGCNNRTPSGRAYLRTGVALVREGLPCRAACVFVVGDSVSCAVTMLMKSVHTTRLVTRAKEFHYCASTRVSQTLMRNESEGACWRAEMGSRKAAPSADPDSLMKDLSESVTVETRKMVIYA